MSEKVNVASIVLTRINNACDAMRDGQLAHAINALALALSYLHPAAPKLPNVPADADRARFPYIGNQIRRSRELLGAIMASGADPSADVSLAQHVEEGIDGLRLILDGAGPGERYRKSLTAEQRAAAEAEGRAFQERNGMLARLAKSVGTTPTDATALLPGGHAARVVRTPRAQPRYTAPMAVAPALDIRAGLRDLVASRLAAGARA